ncbi:MAG TPA: DHA2 family efflux MFS transporter permease subunit [Solirubrobacteraceae bacterium]|jgi:EmrB/QacA subfamily drug resistance transporter|nr:DHA2 family efflux MFS transporter permease subunit [Solirubrobacteraceae bacterium]
MKIASATAQGEEALGDAAEGQTLNAIPRPVRRPVTAPGIVLAVASLGVFMAFVDATIVNIAFPSIERSFPHASLSGLSWVLNAYNIVFAALMVAAGRIADLIGRRRAFRGGLVLFTVASGACAIAPSPVLLVVARIIQAVGAAILVPCSLALVLQAFPQERRAHAVAMWTATAALAAGVGPSLGGLLVSAANWRLAFVANLPIGALAYVLAGRKLVESRTPGRRRLPDLAGALVLALGVGALTLGTVQGPQWGWTDARVLAAFAGAVVLLAVFVVRCRRHRVPILDLDLIRIRNVAVANAAMVVTATAFFSYTLCNVLFLTSVWRYSVLHAGLAITPGPLVAVIVARPISDLAERLGYRLVIFLGALLWASGLIWFITQVGARPHFASEWLPGMLLLGLGAGVVFPNISSAAVASAPGEQFATATAINSVARQLGAVLGVALLVAILGTPASAHSLDAFRHGWWLGAACFGVVGLAALAIGPVARTGVAASDPAPATRPVARTGGAASDRAPAVPAATGAVTRTHLPPAPRARPVRSTASSAEFLRAAPLFAELPEAMLDSIVAKAHRVSLRAGDFLFRQGEDGDCLYLVRSGRLEAISDDDEGARSVALIERGAVVGELAVLARSTRSASVLALRDCELLKITADDFTALMAASAPLATALARTLSVHVQADTSAPPSRRPVPTTIALVPLDDDLPLTEIAEALGGALSQWGEVARLEDQGVGRRIEDPLAEFAPLVDRCEEESDHVLLITGRPDRPSRWTEFSLARADRILAVTAGGPAPKSLTDLATLRGCEVVGYGVAPGSGALSEWTAAVQPVAVHRLDRGGGLAPSAALAARRLAGRSVGVVLSGGGARAFAHLGVLEELSAGGVQIDRIGGVSMGAFIGAQFAAGRGIDEIDACCYEEWVRRNPINDYTIPRRALIRGEKGVAMVRRVFGEVAIEELPRPFYAASADLRRSELVVHRYGSLAELVLASISLPILAPPRIHDGRALIDGSLLDNLPVAPMADTGEGPVIAVDVKTRTKSGSRPRRSSSPPPLGETVARVLQLATTNTTDAAARHADFVIRVGVEGVGLLEFHQIDVAREAGRVAGREALEQQPLPLGS